MLKSELMDLLHELDDDAYVYLDVADCFGRLEQVEVDSHGDIILKS